MVENYNYSYIRRPASSWMNSVYSKQNLPLIKACIYVLQVDYFSLFFSAAVFAAVQVKQDNKAVTAASKFVRISFKTGNAHLNGMCTMP